MHRHKNISPIAIIAYNRSIHFQIMFESLISNSEFNESDIYIFIDGPKNDYDRKEQSKIINYINSFDFHNVTITHRKINIGLSKNVITGINEVLNSNESVIVVEDDLQLSEFFLRFMNDGLNIFWNSKNVASIHGYIYPLKHELKENVFLKGADCWGWATWKRAWMLFESDGEKLLREIKKNKLMKEFNFGWIPYFKKILLDQIKGKNDSWAIRWYASALINEMYTLYPKKSLVRNIGFDGSGTHSGISNFLNVELCQEPLIVDEIEIKELTETRRLFSNYFKKQSLLGLFEKLYKIKK